jgi:hypothetical protein
VIGDDALGVVFMFRGRHGHGARTFTLNQGAHKCPGGGASGSWMCSAPACFTRARPPQAPPPDTDKVLCMDRSPFPGHE